MKSFAVTGVPSLLTASGLMSYVMVMADSVPAAVVVLSEGAAVVVLSSAVARVVVLSPVSGTGRSDQCEDEQQQEPSRTIAQFLH